MKKIFFTFLMIFLINSCSHIYVGNPFIKDKKLREKNYQEYLEKKGREKRQAKEYKLQKQIETDKEFFIQNCYSIDSAQAREECLRNIPK